jgi:hypothetical protein
MAETDSNAALDYTKPFTVELQFRDADGRKYTIEKVTHPLKSMVKNMTTLGKRAPWDTGVLKLLLFAVLITCGSLVTTGCESAGDRRARRLDAKEALAECRDAVAKKSLYIDDRDKQNQACLETYQREVR